MAHQSNRSKTARLLDLVMDGENDRKKLADKTGIKLTAIDQTISNLRADGYPIPTTRNGKTDPTRCAMRLVLPMDVALIVNDEAMRQDVSPADLIASIVDTIARRGLWDRVRGRK